MGFHLAKLEIVNDGNTELIEYIGSQTLYSCADNGAFDSDVSPEIEEYINKNENIMAAVDKEGVPHFISVLKSGAVTGRDVNKFINVVSEKLTDGFLVIY